jgi:hypothetical protein
MNLSGWGNPFMQIRIVQIPDFFEDAAGESGVRPLAYPEIPPSP